MYFLQSSYRPYVKNFSIINWSNTWCFQLSANLWLCAKYLWQPFYGVLMCHKILAKELVWKFHINCQQNFPLRTRTNITINFEHQKLKNLYSWLQISFHLFLLILTYKAAELIHKTLAYNLNWGADYYDNTEIDNWI